MLGIPNLHNGMILSTLRISSHDFVFGFPKRPHVNKYVFLTYKPMIIPLISQRGTTILNKVTLFNLCRFVHNLCGFVHFLFR